MAVDCQLASQYQARPAFAKRQLRRRTALCVLVYLLSSAGVRVGAHGGPYGQDDHRLLQAQLRRDAVDMFAHGYDNYMRHAFPHDELKPLSLSYTDSLGELGNLNMERLSANYEGVALTLVDALSTLAVMGNASEFAWAVRWLSANLDFDADVRVNVFEVNIRLLGGLLSSHLLASDPATGPRLMPGGYDGGLLKLAHDLGRRLLPAFRESPTGLPIPWVNLRHGVAADELTSSNTAACGTFILEFGLLSRLTGDSEFEEVARGALAALWAMRTELSLLGYSLDVASGNWLDANGGIGASADSCYEYLLKAYILFGDEDYWGMFAEAYEAALRAYRFAGGAWYHDSDIFSGRPTHYQFNSLQAFWPGLQVLAGDVKLAADTFNNFLAVWQKYGVIPERYHYLTAQMHSTERHYPLRPELMESALYLLQATGNARVLDAAAAFVAGLNAHARVPGGFAVVRSVASMALEDVQPSYFLAETCKYLFLIADPTFLQGGDYVFTTEGHPIPIQAGRRRRPPQQCAAPHGDGGGSDDGRGGAGGTCAAEAAVPAALRSLRLARKLARMRALHGVPPIEGGPWGTPATAYGRGSSSGQDAGVPESPPPLVPPDWGFHGSNTSALQARLCPHLAAAGGTRVLTACHTRDAENDGACSGNAECGVDAWTCRRRVCSEHHFCVVPGRER
ncbi:hypothetical protein WJX81_001107 [Elliptochloris bilobata]|uniref:alpha-1,2-Mannosidase n=1 Tax=Elliptochloris bilobata TaxID=381761 RepID=A0AAW1QZQ2_9CHLO